MNILMALSQLEVTGAEVYATNIGNELVRRGHKVIYLSDTLTCEITGHFIPLNFNNRSWPRRVWQICRLIYLIKKHNIQLVHAHSRASGWSSFIACRFSGIPMVTTIHGRQPVHLSRKNFHAIGYKAVAVCEEIKNQIVSDLGISEHRVSVVRNGIDLSIFHYKSVQMVLKTSDQDNQAPPVVSIIGRLSGPKGDLCYGLISEVFYDLAVKKKIHLRIVTGSQISERFKKFIPSVEFLDFQKDISTIIRDSDIVIGAGRVAIEALLMGKPVYAVGESKRLGFITLENLNEAMRSNFGDVGSVELDIEYNQIKQEFQTLERTQPEKGLIEKLTQAYSLLNVTNTLEELYQDAVVETLRHEMPILMYHRFIQDPSEKGIHGTWTSVEMFEKHLKFIKKLGFETLTFQDFTEKGFIHRLQPGKKFLMITADDGYQDNLTRMLPLLEKYDLKAVVYVVSDETHNRWDTDHPTQPDTKVPLLTPDEIRKLDASGRVEIGGHTLTHARLDQLSASEQCHEISENKRALESILGHPVLSFAYPFGDLNDSAKKAVQRAGYKFAVATDSGPKALHQDAFQVRRIAVFPRTGVWGLRRKIKGNYVWRR